MVTKGNNANTIYVIGKLSFYDITFWFNNKTKTWSFSDKLVPCFSTYSIRTKIVNFYSKQNLWNTSYQISPLYGNETFIYNDNSSTPPNFLTQIMVHLIKIKKVQWFFINIKHEYYEQIKLWIWDSLLEKYSSKFLSIDYNT